jgi:hypothetical protein
MCGTGLFLPWQGLVRGCYAPLPRRNIRASQLATCFRHSHLVLCCGIHTWFHADAAGNAAILAIGGSKPVVTADANGRIGVEKQMQVNMTADHRIVYGAQGAGAVVL